MAPVSVEITTPRLDSDEIDVVEDLDALVESSKCSCNAGDDNPY
ncbi:MAG: hypothetical protein ACRDTE_14055 [Pseudonocardiaceae bacterium]